MVVKHYPRLELDRAVLCTVMSTNELEVRYAEVCERLAVCLQQNERLNQQLFLLKNEFIERVMEGNRTWENENLSDPPHHIKAD
jgi:hypothetical protein